MMKGISGATLPEELLRVILTCRLHSGPSNSPILTTQSISRRWAIVKRTT